MHLDALHRQLGGSSNLTCILKSTRDLVDRAIVRDSKNQESLFSHTSKT